MAQLIRRRLTFSNVVALLALFIALGVGTVYAAGKINGKQIRRHSIPGNRLKNNSVTGKQVNSSTLGTVPSANTAAALTPGQGFTALPLTTGWKNNAFTAPVGFYKDREGFVHLRGAVDKTSGGDPIATLPAGDRPGPGNDFFAVARDGGLVGELQVTASGELNDLSAGGPTFISLEGVTFFAGN